MSETLSLVNFAIGSNSIASDCGVGRATKRVRRQPEIMTDPIIDGNGQTVQEDNVAKDSYKAKLMGALSIPNGDVCMDEDFELQDTDGTTEMVTGSLPLRFRIRFIDSLKRKWL